MQKVSSYPSTKMQKNQRSKVGAGEDKVFDCSCGKRLKLKSLVDKEDHIKKCSGSRVAGLKREAREAALKEKELMEETKLKAEEAKEKAKKRAEKRAAAREAAAKEAAKEKEL